MIYLDHHATTPLDPRVREAMEPYWSERFANPSSATHSMGRRAAQAVATAREQVASLLGCFPGEIVFTSGATESNNLAILGVVRADIRGRRRVVVSRTEHKAILEPAAYLERKGYEVVRVGVDRLGRVNEDELISAIDENTIVVSIQAASNEVGTLQDIQSIAVKAHAKGAWMHSDATQAVGKIEVQTIDWGVDLLSFNAHKMYGPKGVGGLFRLGGRNGVPIEPLQWGGGQEGELRPGTLNVPGIVGLGMAASLAEADLTESANRISTLRDKLEALVTAGIPRLRLNGDLQCRLPGSSSLTLPDGLDGEAFLAHMPAVALSLGSACTSGAPEPSYVLMAMGLSRSEAAATVRIGAGRFTTDSEITAAAYHMITAYELMRVI